MKRKRELKFAERFNELRGAESQKDFAERIGISRPTVGFYENGDRLPQADILAQIAERCGVTSDWLLGLSDYTYDASRQITLYELGFSEGAANQIASIAGAAETAADLGNQANEKVSRVENPREYTLQEEARAFLALNVLLQSPEFVRVLGNAWAYMRFTGQLDRSREITLNVDEAKESFSAPCDVLLDALWNRVAEPLRNILSAVAHEVQQGTKNIDIPKQKK